MTIIKTYRCAAIVQLRLSPFGLNENFRRKRPLHSIDLAEFQENDVDENRHLHNLKQFHAHLLYLFIR
jgi:hypothetical protein